MLQTMRYTIILLLVTCVFGSATRAQRLPQKAAQLLDAALVGKPVSHGNYLFWLRELDDQRAIYGYDLSRAAEFLVAVVPPTTRTLATDGAVVAWIEQLGGQPDRIQSYDLRTRQRTIQFEAAPTGQLDGLALDAGVLFYHDTTPGHQGIFARTLASGAERQISQRGYAPVAGDGTLLWMEEQRHDQFLPAQWTLHMLRLHTQQPAKLLARSAGPFSAYNVSGDNIVWAAGTPATDRRVYLHRIGAGTTAPIGDNAALFPVIHGPEIVWTEQPPPALTVASRWPIQRYQTETGRQSPLVVDHPTPLATWGLMQNQWLVVTAENAPADGTHTLFITDLRQHATKLPQTAPTPAAVGSLGQCAEPRSCGQVAVRGTELVDARGRWPVHGVQFFLPQRGINTWTFHDSSYAATTADIDRWLDIARDELHVQTLRIFVELPANGAAPTSHATLLDFARRANERGMRLGLVLQNSSDFRMTDERRAWLTGLISYFGERDAKSLIAYVSAANEINNWCSRRDCFDNNPTYVGAAIEWVAQFTDIFKRSNSGILTTVGMATEVADGDGRPAWHNFHQPDAAGRTLASLVDFLSPHNYGGAGYAIIHDLRYALGYGGPVVLEEYGYPTDPSGSDKRYTEGPRVCRDDPWNARCVNTAPYFVELSTRALRETSYAGGVAWMLADNTVKQCGSDPPDLWTGLFASGYGYCGGTYTTVTGRPKATAYRVKLHHLHTPAPIINLWLPLMQQ
ncbi:MAG: hypothetical protein M3R24_14225 [Chloroflexota bacterium]|nr:hypothetical protein [Chloroflexota bacterium]